MDHIREMDSFYIVGEVFVPALAAIGKKEQSGAARPLASAPYFLQRGGRRQVYFVGPRHRFFVLLCRTKIITHRFNY